MSDSEYKENTFQNQVCADPKIHRSDVSIQTQVKYQYGPVDEQFAQDQINDVLEE